MKVNENSNHAIIAYNNADPKANTANTEAVAAQAVHHNPIDELSISNECRVLVGDMVQLISFRGLRKLLCR